MPNREEGLDRTVHSYSGAPKLTGTGQAVGGNDRQQPATRDHRLQTTLDTALTAANTGLVRVDEKTGTLLGLAGVLLGGGLAVLGSTADHMPVAAAAAAWLAAGLVGVAVVLLAGAIKPRLNGNFGFTRWARAADGRQLLAELVDLEEPHGDLPAVLEERANELHWVSCALLTRYTAVRWAVNLLVAGLATAGLAAALTVAGAP